MDLSAVTSLSSRGDQGRDFETFQSHLAETLGTLQRRREDLRRRSAPGEDLRVPGERHARRAAPHDNREGPGAASGRPRDPRLQRDRRAAGGLRHLLDREGTEWLLPSPPPGWRNGKGGAFHVSPRTINGIVKRYVKAAGIHAVGGELALGVHPHLFRHHVGTSMVNDKIPLTVIQKVLDHGRSR
jgi:Phage integrase family